MYTATITKTNFSDGNLQVEVSFTNGTETLLKAFNVSSQSELDNKIKSEVARLNQLESLAGQITIGEYTSMPDPVPPTPTPEQLAKDEFMQKLEMWDALRVGGMFVRAQGVTPKPEEEAEYAQLTAWLLANYKPEYALEAKPILANLGI